MRYIGKLESDILGQLFIGVHLDMPGIHTSPSLNSLAIDVYDNPCNDVFLNNAVGTCDGSLRGRHYFQCPPHHGVFVKPGDVICVTGRKVRGE